VKRLDLIANAVIIAAGVLVAGNAGVAWYHRLFPRPSTGSTSKLGPYSPDQRIGDTAELSLAGVHRTLLLMTASTCHFCSDSMAFYRVLLPVARGKRIAVIGVTAEDPSRNEAFLRKNGVVVDRVISGGRNGLPAGGTPTLVLVRNDGSIVNSWRGKLNPEREEEVIQALSGS